MSSLLIYDDERASELGRCVAPEMAREQTNRAESFLQNFDRERRPLDGWRAPLSVSIFAKVVGTFDDVAKLRLVADLLERKKTRARWKELARALI